MPGPGRLADRVDGMGVDRSGAEAHAPSITPPENTYEQMNWVDR